MFLVEQRFWDRRFYFVIKNTNSSDREIDFDDEVFKIHFYFSRDKEPFSFDLTKPYPYRNKYQLVVQEEYNFFKNAT